MTNQTPNELVDLVAAKFQLLADATRLRIVCSLMRSDNLNVGKIVQDTGRSQANVSKHLKLLTNAGMLARSKKGLQVYYRLNDPVVKKLYHLCRESIVKPGQAQQE